MSTLRVPQWCSALLPGELAPAARPPCGLRSTWINKSAQTIRKQRVLGGAVVEVAGNLVHRPRPGVGELAGWLDVAEEDIGEALALGTGKPGGEHGVA